MRNAKHSGQAADLSRNAKHGGRADDLSRSALESELTGAKRGNPAMRWFSRLLIVAGIVLLGIAGYLWGTAQWNYHKQDEVNKELQQYVKVEDPAQKKGEDDRPVPPVVDWDGLKAVNDDVVAWLQVPGTQINYPVYQAEDNDRYLRHTVTGEYSVGGQLFNDCECTKPGMVDHLTLTYGHHMFDGSMFELIADMDKQETFDSVPNIWYITEANNYLLEPLMLFYTVPEDPLARKFNWPTRKEFREYLRGRLENAVTRRADADKLIEKTDHVLALVTCNYYEGWGRSILICVPKNEVE